MEIKCFSLLIAFGHAGCHSNREKTRTSGHLSISSYAVNTYTHSCWQLWRCHPTSSSHLMMNTPSALFLHQLWHIFLSTQGNLCIEKRHRARSKWKHSLNADVSWQASSRGNGTTGVSWSDSDRQLALLKVTRQAHPQRPYRSCCFDPHFSVMVFLSGIHLFSLCKWPISVFVHLSGDYMYCCFACCWPEQSFLTIRKFLLPLYVLKWSFWCGVTFWILFLAWLNSCSGVFSPFSPSIFFREFRLHAISCVLYSIQLPKCSCQRCISLSSVRWNPGLYLHTVPPTPPNDTFIIHILCPSCWHLCNYQSFITFRCFWDKLSLCSPSCPRELVV